MLIIVLTTILAIAIPWYGGALVVGAVFPTLPALGRIGLGWGVGLGGVTFLMFILAVLRVPLTGVNISLALLLCTLVAAWIAPRLPVAQQRVADVPVRSDPAPLLVRWIVLTMTALALAINAWHNIVWPLTDWDALAAYDLRARAFARFDSVVAAAQHGNLSYALWQPPFTSLCHTWLYEVAGPDAPVKVLYTTCFAALIASFLAFVTIYRSALLAYLTLPGLLLSQPLLEQAFWAYTNLPSAYFFFLASWATYATMRTGGRRWCVMAGVLWGLTMWTRPSLDPFVAVALIALCVPWLRRRAVPWYPAIAAGITLAFAYLWTVFAWLILYQQQLRGNVLAMVAACVTIVGPAAAVSLLALAFFRARQRRLHWQLISALAVLSVLVVIVGLRLRPNAVDLSLIGDLLRYLQANLWPVWGRLYLVLAVCFVVRVPTVREHLGYVLLFLAYTAAYIAASYVFALRFPLWREIPGSAIRHSLAAMPVFWGCIGIMPGTERIVAAIAAFRLAGLGHPAAQAD